MPDQALTLPANYKDTYSSLQSSNDTEVDACPMGHSIARGNEFCPVCGLQIVHYDTELKNVEQILGDLSRGAWTKKDLIFAAAGNDSCSLLIKLLESDQIEFSSKPFMMMNPSDENTLKTTRILERLLPEGRVRSIKSTSLYTVEGSTSQSRSFWGLSKDLAQRDPRISDRLMRVGVIKPDLDQALVLILNIGDGEACGIGPHLLDQARSINPEVGEIALCIAPSADEPDQKHFNAFCALSKLISYNSVQSSDVIITILSDRLSRLRGISSTGRELVGSDALIPFLQLLYDRNAEGGGGVDCTEMAKLSRSLGIQNFVPLMALGRSMEIYGGLSNILDSSLYYPLTPIDKETVTAAHLIVRLSRSLSDELKQNTIQEEFYSWSRRNFPNLKGSLVFTKYEAYRSDRVDTILLVGGCRITSMLQATKIGYERFKAFIADVGRLSDYGTSLEELLFIEDRIQRYEHKIVAGLKHDDD